MASDAWIKCDQCAFRNIADGAIWQAVQSKEFHMPARFAPYLFGFVLSGLMSGVVSAIATLRHAGLTEGFPGLWLNAWLLSWLIAFPVVLIVAPLTRRLVGMVVKAPAAKS
jgi:hypothetical protein